MIASPSAIVTGEPIVCSARAPTCEPMIRKTLIKSVIMTSRTRLRGMLKTLFEQRLRDQWLVWLPGTGLPGQELRSYWLESLLVTGHWELIRQWGLGLRDHELRCLPGTEQAGSGARSHGCLAVRGQRRQV